MILLKRTMVLMLIFTSISVNGQYAVETFEQEYTELSEYQSIGTLQGGVSGWNHQINLEFDFPYYDMSYSQLYLDSGAFISFEDEDTFHLSLMEFHYEYDMPFSLDDISSDVRFHTEVRNGMRVLIIQFTKMRLATDESIEEYDSHVNYQFCLYEDGAIEIRFGPSVLENSTVYTPGVGFELNTSIGPMVLGPRIELIDPLNEEFSITYDDLDSHEQYELRFDGQGLVNYFPPEGWVIRFNRDEESAINLMDSDGPLLYPNPCSDFLQVELLDDIQGVQVFGLTGELLLNQDLSTSQDLDFSILPEGTYLIKVIANDKVYTEKIVKI